MHTFGAYKGTTTRVFYQVDGDFLRYTSIVAPDAVTPDGKPGKVGSVVATPAVPVPATAVGAWMCDAVTPANNPEKVAWTLRVFATASMVIRPVPVPGELLGGASAGPDRLTQ